MRLTHPGKRLYPDVGLTKLDLANYYSKHADWILPHLAGRPLSIVRCPQGVDGPKFFQKHPGPGTPSELRRVAIAEKAGRKEYLVVDDVAGLVALVQIGALELHVWGALADQVEKPDRLIFDLDPSPEVAWPTVIAAANEIRDFLTELGLASFVKTSGGKGVHLTVPIQRRHTWDQVREFCELVARAVERAAPDALRLDHVETKAEGQDFCRLPAQSPRRDGHCSLLDTSPGRAPVSVPLSWKELQDVSSGDAFSLADVDGRLARLRKDPWQEIFSIKQTITAAMLKTLRV